MEPQRAGVVPSRVLLRGGTIYSPERPDATALLTVDGQIAWLGSEADAESHRDAAEAVVELEGRLVTPSFVDAHVHLAKTGLALQTLDLSKTSTVGQALELLAAYARRQGRGVLLAHGWDESRWAESRPPTGAELDRAVGDRVAYVGRVDSHSAVVSTALLERDSAIKTLDGWRGDGVLERDSHHAARAVVESLITAADRKAALLRALRAAAAAGISLVHEANAPHISPYDDAALIAELRREHALPEVVGYWGALLGGDHPDATDVAGFAGDLCMDGALGSRTAALNARYADAPTAGHLYLSAQQVRDHVVWCTRRGVQAGFHVIGDRGVDAVVTGLERAADEVGVGVLVAARHRLEHLEMTSPQAIAALARLGVVASVQPAFDAAWGGPGELYEQRLGTERASSMNAFASMHQAGISLAFGSDSPVTPIDPWGGVRAAVLHHNPDERLSVSTAFAAHTRGGHRARGDDESGVLRSGAPASYAVWDVTGAPDPATPLPVSADATFGVSCVRTVAAGVLVFDSEEIS